MVHVYEDYGYSTYHVHYVEYVHRFRLLRLFCGMGLGISVTASLNVNPCFSSASSSVSPFRRSSWNASSLYFLTIYITVVLVVFAF